MRYSDLTFLLLVEELSVHGRFLLNKTEFLVLSEPIRPREALDLRQVVYVLPLLRVPDLMQFLHHLQLAFTILVLVITTGLGVLKSHLLI